MAFSVAASWARALSRAASDKAAMKDAEAARRPQEYARLRRNTVA